MADLIVYLPNHGYANDDLLYVSWLDSNYYVSDKDTDSFKLVETLGGSDTVSFTTTQTSGYVRTTTGSGLTTISGLDHLEGETVYILANGNIVDNGIVSGGSVTVVSSVTDYIVGLNYISTLQPMKLDISNTGLSVTKKPTRMVISLDQTVGGRIGSSTTNTDPIKYIQAGESGEEFPFFSGDIEMPIPGGYSRAGDVVVRQTEPLPMTVVAMTIDVGASND